METHATQIGEGGIGYTLQGWQESFCPRACGDRVFTVSGPRYTHVVVADGCGKGAEAAEIARRFESIASHDLGRRLSTAVLRRWNTQLSAAMPRLRFVTLTVVELAHACDEVRVYNAGNPAALLIGADGTIACINSNGPPLGILPDEMLPDFTVARLRLRCGDRLLVHTDGLSEQPCNGSCFGEHALLSALQGQMGRCEPLAAVCGAMRHLLASGAAIGDDITAVQIGWNGAGQAIASGPVAGRTGDCRPQQDAA